MSKKHFIELLIKSQVLKFGEFQTKSGRISPYFFNAGEINSGSRISEVADIYAELIQRHFKDNVENLYGPSYKGIPLAVATCMPLSHLLNRDIGFTYNRKEKKDHGEGGIFVGQPYNEAKKIVIIEDVLTAGTSLRESIELLSKTQAKIIGAVVGIDRQEAGTGKLSAREEIESDYGFPIHSIINLDDVIEVLWNKEVLGKVWINDSTKEKIDIYRQEFSR